MFDAKKLLDQLVGPQGGQLAGELLKAGQSYLGQGAGAALKGATDVFGAERVGQARDYLDKNGQALGIGAAAGGLLGVLLGTETGRSAAGTAAKLGTLAIVGGLAWKAYRSWQQGEGAGAAGAGTPDLGDPPEAPEADQQALAQALIVAMINAAKADGVIDPTEYRTIVGKAASVGIDAEASAFLQEELSSPVDIEKVVAASMGPEVATQIYAASALAIRPDKNSEKAYLAELASRLGLAPGLVAEIDARVEAARG